MEENPSRHYLEERGKKEKAEEFVFLKD